MAGFKPAWWCLGPHAQTLWRPLFARGPRISLRRERLELPDGDFIDLDWTQRQNGPIVIVLHGLEGSSRSAYARGLLQHIDRLGWRGVVMHFRGCSGEPNRLPRSYHSGDTADLAFVISHLQTHSVPLAAVGYSLGGNVLLKWLGETGEQAGIEAAVAVSVPFVLSEAADRFTRGFSRLYQWALLRQLHLSYRRKFARLSLPLRPKDVFRLRRFWDFDEHVTAPLHGFAGAADYYARSSSRSFLHGIRVPTLVIHAEDDPFMTRHVIPTHAELSPAVRLEVSQRGGHVGFVAGRWPWRPRYWLDERIPAYLTAFFEAK